MWQISDLLSESDVEQKFIYQFLIEPQPVGLGIPPSTIQTKANLRRFQIGKGSDLKVYYPDYIVAVFGLPLVVIEAKSPNEAVAEGYREARLYAQELNALYTSGNNPAKYIVATNGKELWYGLADHAEPIGKADVATLGTYSLDIASLYKIISWTALEAYSKSLAKNTSPNALFKPRRLVGGAGTQNEEVGRNTFGATLTASISTIFNPTTRRERAFIARHGYISSMRRERFVDPIDKVIRAARPASETEATVIEDTSRPRELIGRLKERRELEHKILLLIGSAGSGKTTFVDHLHEVALPRDLIDSTVWCRIDMNAAPVSPAEIYNWLRAALISCCRLSLPDEDFDDYGVLRKIFGAEINRFTKGIGQLYHTFVMHAAIVESSA